MHSQYFGLCFIKMASYYTYLSSNCFSYSVISYRNLFKSIGRELMKFFIGCLIFHDMTVPTLSPHHVHFLALPQLLWPHRALEHGVLFHDPHSWVQLVPFAQPDSKANSYSYSQDSSAACSREDQATGAEGSGCEQGQNGHGVSGQFMRDLWSLVLIPECRRLLEGLKLGNDLC